MIGWKASPFLANHSRDEHLHILIRGPLPWLSCWPTTLAATSSERSSLDLARHSSISRVPDTHKPLSREIHHRQGMGFSATPDIETLKTCVLNLAEPMGKRTRAVFYLRSIGSKEAMHILLQALINQKDSELMRHELAYVIGQFQDPEAISVLSSVVSNLEDDTMVRHEAAEALGAIGHPDALSVLQKFQHDSAPEVAETCQLAIDLLDYRAGSAGNNESSAALLDANPYCCVDPAPAAEKSIDIHELQLTLLNTQASLFTRYRAMFSLRNRNTEDSALALASGFGDQSVLFRHEIAYVLGQMEHPSTVLALKTVLEDPKEHKMVRHEAAEALGAIGTPECQQILLQYQQDDHQVVRESCEVALDAIDYWGNNHSGTVE